MRSATASPRVLLTEMCFCYALQLIDAIFNHSLSTLTHSKRGITRQKGVDDQSVGEKRYEQLCEVLSRTTAVDKYARTVGQGFVGWTALVRGQHRACKRQKRQQARINDR